MTSKKTSTDRGYVPTRLFRHHAVDLLARSVWNGAGVLNFLVITNNTSSAVTCWIYDVEAGSGADSTTVLANDIDVPPNTSIIYRFPEIGIGIPTKGERAIHLKASVAGAVVFHGYGELT